MINKLRRWLLVSFICWPLTVFAANNTLTRFSINTHAGTAEIRFTLQRMESPAIFVLTHPDRLVVDFKNTRLQASIPKLTLKKTLILQIRKGYPKPGISRFVFDLNQPIHLEKTINQRQKTLALVLYPTAKTIKTIVKPMPRFPAHKLIIVIDPGHGGHDPGAIGKWKVAEKRVVLQIARELADLINQNPHMQAILTRHDDYFMSLWDRLMIARKNKADLFIAIHADSFFNKRAEGASVYALSSHGATSVAARWLAIHENHSELNNVALGDLNDQSYVLRSVLIDLAQTATIRDSLYLAKTLLKQLQTVTRLHYRRVEQAPFMVLKSPDIPSILVETGFISNPREELRLRDPAYQHKLAQALYDGICLYQHQYTA